MQQPTSLLSVARPRVRTGYRSRTKRHRTFAEIVTTRAETVGVDVFAPHWRAACRACGLTFPVGRDQTEALILFDLVAREATR